MVVSGAPVKENDHADRVCDMALDMVEAITDLKDRSTGMSRDVCKIAYVIMSLLSGTSINLFCISA